MNNSPQQQQQQDEAGHHHHHHHHPHRDESDAVSLMSSMDVYSQQLTRLFNDSSSSTLNVLTQNVCK